MESKWWFCHESTHIYGTQKIRNDREAGDSGYKGCHHSGDLNCAGDLRIKHGSVPRAIPGIIAEHVMGGIAETVPRL